MQISTESVSSTWSFELCYCFGDVQRIVAGMLFTDDMDI